MIKKLSDGNYIVSEDTLKDFMETSAKLDALETSGVDNWTYYDERWDTFFAEERAENPDYGVEDYVREWLERIEEYKND